MLNNTKHKSELDELQGIVEDQLVTRLRGINTTAANTSDYNQVVSTERSIRRERRNRRASGFSAGGWRVTAW